MSHIELVNQGRRERHEYAGGDLDEVAAELRGVIGGAAGRNDNEARPGGLEAGGGAGDTPCQLALRATLVVGIPQPGGSTDTNAVLAAARERGAITVGITNKPRNAMAGTADQALLVRAGKEVG